MIEIVVSVETLKIIIPEEMRAEAQHHLGNIWRDEFAGRHQLGRDGAAMGGAEQPATTKEMST